VPRRNTILQLSTPTPTLSPQTPHLFHHLANKLRICFRLLLIYVTYLRFLTLIPHLLYAFCVIIIITVIIIVVIVIVSPLTSSIATEEEEEEEEEEA